MVDKPDIDLFASSLNAKCHRFVSWGPDSSAWIIDAFSFSWADLYVYAFLPFAILNRTLTKLEEDQATAILKAVLNWAEHSVREQLCLLEIFKFAVRFLIDVFDHGEQLCSRPIGRCSDVRNVGSAGYWSKLLIG